MYDKIFKQQAKLYDRLDELEGHEDDPVYADEIKEIQKELNDIELMLNTEFF